MNRYEKNHRRTNYYQNNGYDEQWEVERDSYDNRNYPVQNGYLNEQWSDDNGYHDNVTYDSRDETMYHDNNHDDRQDDHVRIEESNNESFERKEETSALSE